MTLSAESAGESTISVGMTNLDEDDEAPLAVRTTSSLLTVQAVEPVDGKTPQNVDDDPTYEDLNANGMVDYDDVVVYYNNMNQPSITDHVVAYDYNGNMEAGDHDDVVALFEETM